MALHFRLKSLIQGRQLISLAMVRLHPGVTCLAIQQVCRSISTTYHHHCKNLPTLTLFTKVRLIIAIPNILTLPSMYI